MKSGKAKKGADRPRNAESMDFFSTPHVDVGAIDRFFPYKSFQNLRPRSRAKRSLLKKRRLFNHM
jgi:hypothetical protein